MNDTRDGLEKAPRLGLYLAVVWITCIALPIMFFLHGASGIKGTWDEASDTWRRVGVQR